MKRTEYRYQVGEVVNGTLKIVEQTRKSMNKNNYTNRAYIVQSLVYPDAPTYIITEYHLLRGQGCSYKVGQRVYEGNSLYSIEKIRPFLTNIEQAKKIARTSTKKIIAKCTNCETKREIAARDLNLYGVCCKICSKSISYPELFMTSYLKAKGISFETQVRYNDLPNRRFDFKIKLNNKNILIETHGNQHYSDKSKKWGFSDTIKSDSEKREFCYNKGIELIELDCRISSFEYIEKSINNNETLPNIDLKDISKIKNFIEKNKKYDVKKIIEQYKQGHSTLEIGKFHNVSDKIILSILKKVKIPIRSSHKLSAKEYNSLIEEYMKGDTMKNIASKYGITRSAVGIILKRNNVTTRIIGKKVKCLNTGEVFINIKKASEWAIQACKISECCKGKRNFSGKHPITGEKLTWEYVEEQIENNTYSNNEENLHIA